jgi:hypothetical protein
MAKKWQGRSTINATTLEPYCGVVNPRNPFLGEMTSKKRLGEPNQEI